MTSENGKENGEMSQGGKKTWVYKAQEAGADWKTGIVYFSTRQCRRLIRISSELWKGTGNALLFSKKCIFRDILVLNMGG